MYIYIYPHIVWLLLKTFEMFIYFDPEILLLLFNSLEIMASIQRSIANEPNITYNKEKIRTSESLTIIYIIFQGLTKVPDIYLYMHNLTTA